MALPARRGGRGGIPLKLQVQDVFFLKILRDAQTFVESAEDIFE